MRYIVIAVLASAITVFALQNNAAVEVQFLMWKYAGIPLATVILVSVVAGLLLAGIPLLIGRWRLRSRIRTLEDRLAAPRTPPPPTAPPPRPPAPPPAPPSI